MGLFNRNQDTRIARELESFDREALTGIDPGVHADTFRRLKQNHIAFTGERLIINDAVQTHYRNVLEEHMARYELACRLVTGLTVLDAACGSGFGTEMMACAGARHVTGIDISDESIRQAVTDYTHESIDFRIGDIRQLPFASGSFEAVVSFETIEHVPDGSAWIRESARVLEPGGLFLVSTPNRKVTNAGLYYGEQPVNRYHEFEYSALEFVGELLQEYDILALYGQTFVKDVLHAGEQWLRQLYNRQASPAAEQTQTPLTGSRRLLPIGAVKNAQPAFIVAVCRKKA